MTSWLTALPIVLWSEHVTEGQVHRHFNGVLLPVPFHSIDVQSLEQFSLTREKRFQRTDHQRLAKAARTRQKVIFPLVYHLPHPCRLVNIGVAVATNAFEILYANRVLHNYLSVT